MRAVRVVAHEGPRSLSVESDVPVPDTSGGQVVVRVHAAGVTYPDVLQTHGAYQLRFELPITLGSEFAGIVASAPSASRFRVGQRVAGIVPWGAFADYCAARDDQLVPLPDSASLVTAAGMPMNVLTADFALGHRGRLRPEETVLVHGAAGGLGIAVIQRAKQIGSRVIAVVSTTEKEALARRAGADEVVRPVGFLDAARSLTDGRGVDMVVDPVGGERFTDSLRLLAPDGRLLVMGFTGGSIPSVKVNRLLLNNISVIGVGWGGLAGNARVSIPEQWDALLPTIASGGFDPFISQVFSAEEASEALARLDERRVAGKIVIQFAPEVQTSP